MAKAPDAQSMKSGVATGHIKGLLCTFVWAIILSIFFDPAGPVGQVLGRIGVVHEILDGRLNNSASVFLEYLSSSLGTLFGLLTFVFVHEGGHALAAIGCGLGVASFRFGDEPYAIKLPNIFGSEILLGPLPFGGLVKEKKLFRCKIQVMIFALGGPLANIILGYFVAAPHISAYLNSPKMMPLFYVSFALAHFFGAAVNFGLVCHKKSDGYFFFHPEKYYDRWKS